jgi:hypothetical protein
MSSENTNDLDALIIRNLADLDAAVHRLVFEIQPQVEKEINDLGEKWAAKNGWQGVFGWYDDALWVAPPNWDSGEDGWRGKFFLDGGDGDTFGEKRWEPEEDMFWLTRLCRKGRGQMGFRWYFDKGLAITPSRWKAFLRANPIFKESIAREGFVAEDKGWFFLKFEVDPDKLATSIQEGDVQAAFQPMQAAPRSASDSHATI